jgi:hypothetical protein
MEDILKYYSEPWDITNLSKYEKFIGSVPRDVRAIFQIVQGLIVHDLWIGRYGSRATERQKINTNTTYMKDILDKALELENKSLALPRSVENRVLGSCREFSTLFCAILRHKGISARCRCGFALYLAYPGYFEDHWICEYWNESEKRWIMVDPQIDPFQQSALGIDFDPLDIPKEQFITGAKAWWMCRKDEADPERFGIACDPKLFNLDSLNGLWFVRGNLLRDFAALNKVETEPFLVRIGKGLTWSPWRLVSETDDKLSCSDYDNLDKISELSINPDCNFDQIRDIFESNEELMPPLQILC